MLRQALTELMPLDDARRAELLVRRAFADQAAHNARLAAIQSETLVGIRSPVTQAIKNGMVCGEAPQEIDAADRALQIVACTEGLALDTHIDPDGTPKAAVLAALDDQLGRIFTGTCRHAQLGWRCARRHPWDTAPASGSSAAQRRGSRTRTHLVHLSSAVGGRVIRAHGGVQIFDDLSEFAGSAR
ncbi:TetR family transcriptional regulator C-terminal domain-containing protein [Streptomyces sp. NPDC057249]|uniref:TetR family transcriptional regulator C-terminal domain-containing protein n=1 Tax=Streptomyces sp. NPDC057249 TaxID=3346067 RepID=UPI0036317C56